MRLTLETCFCFRLALSHNKISSFPARFSECTLLRYLNVRSNRISEFPLPVNNPSLALLRFSFVMLMRVMSDLLSAM